MYVCMYVCMCVCVCMYVCMCVCMCVCVCGCKNRLKFDGTFCYSHLSFAQIVTYILTITNTINYELNFYSYLRGKKDTKASLRLNRAGKDIDFTVVRKAFRLKGKNIVAVITKRQNLHLLYRYLTEVDSFTLF